MPEKALLTPHTGEMQALLNSPEKLILTQDLLNQCQDYAEKHQITLILKGAPTFIFHPQTPIYVNPRGDPGMATAGSGDVLTGILASLLSQGLDCHQAAILASISTDSQENLRQIARHIRGILANDLIDYLAAAYSSFPQNNLWGLLCPVLTVARWF